jgi:hypothetical protein
VPEPASPASPSSPSPAAAEPADPSEPSGLADLAVLLHRATEDQPAPILFGLAVGDGEARLGLGHWALPPAAHAHPADALVGHLAPDRWEAAALAGPAELLLPWLDPGPHVPGPVAPARRWATVVLDRGSGGGAVVGRPGRRLVEVEVEVVGWTTDALARLLGRPTRPPEESVVEVLEASWLDLVASQVLVDPGAVRTWVALAALHPLCDGGRVEEPGALAAATRALDATTSWPRLRTHLSRRSEPAGRLPVPESTRVPREHWHDDGSFARFAARNLGPAHEVLTAVLSVLPGSLAERLVDALTTVGPSAAPADGHEVGPDPIGTGRSDA